jgi:hypothetical protein
MKSILSSSLLVVAASVLLLCTGACNSKKKAEAEKIVIKTDLAQLKVGDYYYNDGTFSTGQDSTKIAIGVVFSLNTSEAEKKQGWTHGKIVALMNAATSQELEWGVVGKDLSSPFGSYAWRNWKGASNVLNGYACSHASAVGGADYKVFRAIKEMTVKLPEGKSSGWYLPSVGEWAEIIGNIGKVKVDSVGCFDTVTAQDNLKILGLGTSAYWSSTQSDKNLSWFVSFPQGKLTACSKDTRNRARLVAAL